MSWFKIKWALQFSDFGYISMWVSKEGWDFSETVNGGWWPGKAPHSELLLVFFLQLFHRLCIVKLALECEVLFVPVAGCRERILSTLISYWNGWTEILISELRIESNHLFDWMSPIFWFVAFSPVCVCVVVVGSSWMEESPWCWNFSSYEQGRIRKLGWGRKLPKIVNCSIPNDKIVIKSTKIFVVSPVLYGRAFPVCLIGCEKTFW